MKIHTTNDLSQLKVIVINSEFILIVLIDVNISNTDNHTSCKFVFKKRIQLPKVQAHNVQEQQRRLFQAIKNFVKNV